MMASWSISLGYQKGDVRNLRPFLAYSIGCGYNFLLIISTLQNYNRRQPAAIPKMEYFM